MRKTLSVLIVLVLALGMTQVGFAVDKYPSVLIHELDMTSTEMTTESNRATTAALLLIDYMIALGGDASALDTLSVSGYGRIAAYSSCVYVYYLRSDGRYFNLFVAPYTGEISDFGVSVGGPTSTEHVYYYVAMEDIVDAMAAILELVSD